MTDEQFRTARKLVVAIVLGLVAVAVVSGCSVGASPSPSAAQCRSLSEAQAALSLCLKVQGCYVTPADIRAAMSDGREKQAVGCPE